jgi:tetratricopeptide (TPR) repeat protein
LDEAVAAYEKAAAVAGDAGDLQQAFSLRYKAALVEHSRQHHRAAADKLRSLGSDMSTNEKAADVHLLAAWNAAQLSRSDPTALPLYEEILSEHLATWPAGSTTDTARLWLGRLRESQEEFAAAADAYQGVSRGTPPYDQAMRAAARCSHTHINRLRDAGLPYGEFAETVALFFEEQIRGLLGDGSKSWTPTDRFCAEQAARFWLETDSSGYGRAESVLSAALAGVPDPDPAWKNAAESVLIVALAGQEGKRAQAEATLLRLGDGSPGQLLEILSAVAEIQASSPESTKRELAGLQLAVVDKLSNRRSQFDDATLRSLDQIRAQALVLAGRRDEALATYARLASENPDDGPIQEAYAEQLVAAGDQESMQAALEQWRRVASRSNAHSERWYLAKYGVASALHALGKKEEAADRIRYLLTIPPGVKDAKWKTQFETLLAQCE